MGRARKASRSDPDSRMRYRPAKRRHLSPDTPCPLRLPPYSSRVLHASIQRAAHGSNDLVDGELLVGVATRRATADLLCAATRLNQACVPHSPAAPRTAGAKAARRSQRTKPISVNMPAKVTPKPQIMKSRSSSTRRDGRRVLRPPVRARTYATSRSAAPCRHVCSQVRRFFFRKRGSCM